MDEEPQSEWYLNQWKFFPSRGIGNAFLIYANGISIAVRQVQLQMFAVIALVKIR